VKNYIQPGDVLPLTAPTGGVVAGTAYKIGQVLVIATASVAQGLPFEGKRQGVFEVAKVSAQAWTEGAVIYWDDTAKLFTTTATSNLAVGFAVAAAANPSSTGKVCLHGVAAPVGAWV
jgi:predicted RecA/RadA family phage recombinase